MNAPYSIGLSILITIASLQADSNKPADDTIWSRSWSVGGGASDSCYYFVGRDGEATRVRILYLAAYDDGARGTDYFLKNGSIRVDKIRGSKLMTAQQMKGYDDGITVAATYTLTTKSAKDALLSSPGNEQLTMEQRHDLGELITIMKDCIPAKIEKAEKPGGHGDPATAPESKREGEDKTKPEAEKRAR